MPKLHLMKAKELFGRVASLISIHMVTIGPKHHHCQPEGKISTNKLDIQKIASSQVRMRKQDRHCDITKHQLCEQERENSTKKLDVQQNTRMVSLNVKARQILGHRQTSTMSAKREKTPALRVKAWQILGDHLTSTMLARKRKH